MAKTAAGVVAGIGGLQYIHCQNRGLSGARCVADFADTFAEFRTAMASAGRTQSAESDRILQELRAQLAALTGTVRHQSLLMSSSGESRSSSVPWSTVLVLLSVAAAGGLAYWQMPSIFHGILPATKANLNDVAGNVKKFVSQTRAFLTDRIAAVMGRVEVVDKRVEEVHGKVGEVQDGVTRVGSQVEGLEESLADHGRMLQGIGRMHSVSMNLLLWLSHIVADVSRSVPTVSQTARDGLRAVLDSAAWAPDSLQAPDLYALRSYTAAKAQAEAQTLSPQAANARIRVGTGAVAGQAPMGASPRRGQRPRHLDRGQAAPSTLCQDDRPPLATPPPASDAGASSSATPGASWGWGALFRLASGRGGRDAALDPASADFWASADVPRTPVPDSKGVRVQVVCNAATECSDEKTSDVTKSGPQRMYPPVDTAGATGPENVRIDEPAVALAERVWDLQMRLDMPEELVRDLLNSAGTDIVVIADDSGSMASVVDTTDVTRPKTRWDELQETLSDLVSMLLLVDHNDGFALRLLNDPQWYTIRDASRLREIFARRKPNGATPLREVLQQTFDGKWTKSLARKDHKEVFVLVLTDGEPSDCNFDGLATLLRHRTMDPAYYVSFLMCTNEDDVVVRYNTAIDPIKGCDVSDDYQSEKREVQRKGRSKFSKNEWLAKAVLGAKYEKYDSMDEGKGGCCSVM